MTKKGVIFAFCALLLFLSVSSVVALAASPKDSDAVLSPGLAVMAEEYDMAMAAICGNDVLFETSDFLRAVNLSSISSITFTEVPPVTDGELRVGSTVVGAGQTVSAGNLSLLRYVPKSDSPSSTTFRFRTEGGSCEIPCHIYLLDKINYAPTLSIAPETSLCVSTHRNITRYGTLSAYDPDGDEPIIEIVSYPTQGLLHLTDRNAGTYTYTPYENFTGKDSFTYVARDKYGNYSASKTVSLTVTKPKTSVVYQDMLSSPSYHAALNVTEEGIMCGTEIGNDTYFYPTQTVSRAEFLVMAMNACGIDNLPDTTKTVFADDSEIPQNAKCYVACAYELGIIKGLYVDDVLCFAPNESIRRADAALIVHNLLGAETPDYLPTFSDAADIPSYAKIAVSSMCSMGVLPCGDGARPLEKLTRAEAAEILSAMLFLEGEK